MSSTNGKVFFGFLVGAALGAAAGLLFAPRSGVETRQVIKDKSKEYSDNLAERIDSKLSDIKKYVGNVADNTKARVRKASPKGQED